MPSPEPKPVVGDPVLTPAQMRFAREHRARPAHARMSDGSIFFYRDHFGGTRRWLVDNWGEVVDEACFPSGAPRGEMGNPPATRAPRLGAS